MSHPLWRNQGLRRFVKGATTGLELRKAWASAALGQQPLPFWGRGLYRFCDTGASAA